MSKQRRGKKLITQNSKENFTKVPNALIDADGLNSTEKLVLIKLHYFPSNWTLAYTRLHKDLKISERTIKDCWKSLKQKGYIIEDEETYSINYALIEGAISARADSAPMEKVAPLNVQNLPTKGAESSRNKVQILPVNGADSTPIEEDTKEEDYKNKTKEEDYTSKVQLSKPEASPSEPVEHNKALDIVQSNIEVKTSTNRYSTNMRNAKYYKLIFKQNFTISTIEEYFNDFSIEEKNILNTYYQTLKGRLKENYNKENYLYLQLMYSLFLSKSIDFTNMILDKSSIDRTDFNIVDNLYEDYMNSSIEENNISIDNNSIVTTQSTIVTNVAPCATDSSNGRRLNNTADAHASGEGSAPATNEAQDDDLPFNLSLLNDQTRTGIIAPERNEARTEERKAIERQAKLVALELAEQFFGEY